MGGPQLSSGVLARALSEENFSGGPIYLQCLEVQHIKPKDGTGSQRYKVTVSDGVYKCIALLATQLKDLVDGGQLTKGAIMEVKDLVGNKKLPGTASGASRKLLIILTCAVVGTWPETIGNPQPPPNLEDTNSNGAAPSNGSTAGAAAAGGSYGAPPPGFAGGYGGPPPAASANGAPSGPGMYGGGPGAAPQYGGPPGSMQQQGGGGMYGGQPQQQQQQGRFGGPPQGGGMYGGGQGGPPAAGGGGGGGGGMYGGGGGPMGGGRAAGGGGGMGGAGPAYGMGGGGSGGPIAHSNEPLRIVPIKALNPYQARWTIKARVTQKGDVRRWSNPRSEGKLLSFDLVDKDGGEIRATAWNDQVEAFNDMIQVGRVLMISRASLKPRNPRFNSTPHEYEIYLERSSQLIPCDEDAEAAAIPFIMFNFRKLSDLETIEAGTILDVIGVVDNVEPWSQITRKDGTDTRKRSISIRDDSGRSVEVTLWDKFATGQENGVPAPGDQLEQAVQQGMHPVLALKSARVGDFNGKNLGSLGSSTVLINPDRPEAQQLRAWFDQGGGTQHVAPLSERGGGGGGRQDRRICFAQINSEGLGTSGQADWVQATGTISFINQNQMTYPACPKDFNGRTCNKKLQDTGGQWFCDRCQASCDQPVYRYLLSVTAQDHTDGRILSAFGDAGEIIMGRPASDIANMDNLDTTGFATIISQRVFQPYSFKLKIFQDVYNDEARTKVTISKITPLDPVAEGRTILDLIHKLDAGQPILTAPTAAATAGGGGGASRSPFGGGTGTQFAGGPGPTQQYGRGPGPSSYGGGPGGTTQYGGPGPSNTQQQGGGWQGGGGGWNNGPAGGGGWNNGGGGMMQQQQPGGYGGGGYGGPPGGGMGGGGGGGGGGNSNWGGGPGGGGGYGSYGGQQQQPGGYGQQQQQQYNQAPFNAGFL